MPRIVVAAAAVALLTATLASGVVATAPAVASARTTPPTVVSAETTSSLALSTPGPQVVQSIKLTKGTWTLMGKASAGNFGASGDFFRCELVDVTHDTVLDGATAFLNPAVDLDVITNLAVLTVTGRVTISQECSHDGTAGDGGGIEAGSSLVGFVNAPWRVRTARTTTQTNLVDTGNIPVLGLSLPKGTWVVAAKATPVVLSSALVQVTCSDDSVSGGAQRALGTQSGLHAVSTIFKVGALVTLTKPGTVTLACGATGDGSYIDPGAVLWAWKADDAQLTATGPCPVTLSGTAAADALVIRQSSNCDIASGSFPSELIGSRLKAGTWVAFGGVVDLDSQGQNTVQCELFDTAHKKQHDVSTASLSTYTSFPSTGIANLAVIKVSKALPVNGMCGELAAGASAVSVSSGWAFIKP